MKLLFCLLSRGASVTKTQLAVLYESQAKDSIRVNFTPRLPSVKNHRNGVFKPAIYVFFSAVNKLRTAGAGGWGSQLQRYHTLHISVIKRYMVEGVEVKTHALRYLIGGLLGHSQQTDWPNYREHCLCKLCFKSYLALLIALLIR